MLHVRNHRKAVAQSQMDEIKKVVGTKGFAQENGYTMNAVLSYCQRINYPTTGRKLHLSEWRGKNVWRF